ncbi:MAG TPA: hypothetical protein VEP67_02780 [Thiobacillaceae bacterium]|nr:hypothetical protein [Thiobacillaceae bacterium]
MKLQYAFAVLAAAGALSGPVKAQEPSPPPDLERFRALVKPADVDLFFNYLRDSVKAGMEGRAPPPPPPQLSQRARELAESFRQEGAMTLDQMLEMIRQEMKKSLPPPEPSATPRDDCSDKPDYRT